MFHHSFSFVLRRIPYDKKYEKVLKNRRKETNITKNS